MEGSMTEVRENQTIGDEQCPSSFVYRDYSHVPSDGGDPLTERFTPETPPSIIRIQKLPVKLNVILSNPKFSHIITWMPHGRSWKVIQPKLFLSEVIPLYFEYCNYNSFIRLVNAWGFRRMSKGKDRNSYYHELFLRGMPHLHKRMKRLAKTEKKVVLSPEGEPDLEAFSRAYPLPDENACNVEKNAPDFGWTPCNQSTPNTMDPMAQNRAVPSLGSLQRYHPQPSVGMGQYFPKDNMTEPPVMQETQECMQAPHQSTPPQSVRFWKRQEELSQQMRVLSSLQEKVAELQASIEATQQSLHEESPPDDIGGMYMPSNGSPGGGEMVVHQQRPQPAQPPCKYNATPPNNRNSLDMKRRLLHTLAQSLAMPSQGCSEKQPPSLGQMNHPFPQPPSQECPQDQSPHPSPWDFNEPSDQACNWRPLEGSFNAPPSCD